MRFATATYNDQDPTLVVEFRGAWYDLGAAFADEHGLPLESFDDLLVVEGLMPQAMGLVAALAEDGDGSYRIDDELQLLQPLGPGKIICIGRNYQKHAEELGNDVPDEPLIFDKVASSCIGPDEPIIVDPELGRVDHEGELAVVIGEYCYQIEPEEAESYVAGYTLLNDVTARDWQDKLKAAGHPWFICKNIDSFCPIGPAVVPRDALAWPPVLDLEVVVNGDLRQRGNTGDFIFSIAEIISYISHFVALEPGDLVATGTPEGVGPLRPGDEVVVRIAEIGELRNPVVSPDEVE